MIPNSQNSVATPEPPAAEPVMTGELAWEILESYCTGNFKKHCSKDTARALSWALNRLQACEAKNEILTIGLRRIGIHLSMANVMTAKQIVDECLDRV